MSASSSRKESSAEDACKVRVWDLPTRVFHWGLVLLVLAAYLAQEFGLMVWHQRMGLSIIAFIAFRLAWGWVGSTHARFSSFVCGPAAVLAYLRGHWRGDGHNPLGGWAVLVLLLLPLAMALTGLFANDDVDFRGMLAGRVSGTTSENLTRLHGWLFDALLIMIVLHVATIAAYAWFKRQNLLRPMITGHRPQSEDRPGVSYSGGGGFAFVLALVVAAGALAVVFALVPESVPLPADYVAPDW